MFRPLALIGLALAMGHAPCGAAPMAETPPSQNLATTVQPGPNYPGKIAASDVPIRGLCPRPMSRSDPHDTLKAIKSFHATRLEWTYSLTKEFVKKVRQLGVTVSSAVNTGTGMMGGGHYQNSVLTLDLKSTTAPWMRRWQPPGYWFCVNNPATREMSLAHSKALIDLGVQDIQRDDPAANEAAVDWGGCFCPACMAGFRDYLRQKVTPEKLRALGIQDIHTFDYRRYLISQKAPVGDAFRNYPGGELKQWFEAFQTQSSVNFHQWLHEELNRYAGAYVPFSSNNGASLFGEVYQPFDFWIGELFIDHATPPYLFDLARRVRSMGKGQILTMPLSKDPAHTPGYNRTIRNSIATSYALGMHMEVPWDTYLPTPLAERFFGEPQDFADLYAMVRASADFLNGYENAAATGARILDDRWPENARPVAMAAGFPDIAAFTSAKPNTPDAPIVIHVVDWSTSPSVPCKLVLRPELLFSGRPFRATLITPKPYDPAAHNRAFDTKNYAPLVDRKELGKGRLDSLDLPALAPWGIVVLEPLLLDRAKR